MQTLTDDDAQVSYPDAHHGLEPAPEGTSVRERKAAETRLRAYSTETWEMYDQIPMHGKYLYLYFITAFRPHSGKSWSRSMLSNFTFLLIDRVVHEELGQG